MQIRQFASDRVLQKTFESVAQQNDSSMAEDVDLDVTMSEAEATHFEKEQEHNGDNVDERLELMFNAIR